MVAKEGGTMSEHISVLKDEAIDYLNIKPEGIYVDCTLGGGGHASAIASRLTTGHLFAFDQDDYAIARAKDVLAPYPDVVTYVRANFVDLAQELHTRGIDKVDGILYDLGVSSFQFDIPERGFSYNHDAPLDMRMDPSSPTTAADLVNHASFHDLKNLLHRYGEEPSAKWIARAIEQQRAIQPIETTFQLVNVIKQALPQKVLSKKGHPAKRTFQALRIAVNDELRVFEDSLSQAFDLLKVGGRIVVITFHSLEDRIAKQMFAERSTLDFPKHLPILPDVTPEFQVLHRKVIRPSEAELADNNRAHSAKLRAIERIKEPNS
jgi:16S rRNA (cytosine1402-N4)-methyltransferase